MPLEKIFTAGEKVRGLFDSGEIRRKKPREKECSKKDEDPPGPTNKFPELPEEKKIKRKLLWIITAQGFTDCSMAKLHQGNRQRSLEKLAEVVESREYD